MALFMISQPETPNLPYIPGTTEEAGVIQRLFQDHDLEILSLEGEAATVSQAMIHMETHSYIHFACHGHQNTIEPLKSRFMLHDGDIELSEILKKQLKGANLAYLSACQTSTGDERLSDEAVHLAAGMLAAGYRGVVATMWSISDQYGPQIAEDFYANLIAYSEEQNILSSENAACALHYAVQKLQKKLDDSESSLLVWIPYVHFGL
jgi:CHAT domain-containing protein